MNHFVKLLGSEVNLAFTVAKKVVWKTRGRQVALVFLRYFVEWTVVCNNKNIYCSFN
jgi:hypothetical protein